MLRKQIYINESQEAFLKLESQRTHSDVSQLIRDAIDEFLSKRQKTADWNNDSLSKAIGKIKLDVNDASAHHDKYLYD